MEKLWDILLDGLRKQGFSVVLLVVAVAWFGYRDFRREMNEDALYDAFVKYLNDDRREMLRAIEQNTRALDAFVYNEQIQSIRRK